VALALGRAAAPSCAAPTADVLPLRSEPFNPERHHVARLQIDRGRLLAHADTRGRTSRDDVAGKQRHDPADVADQSGNAENHSLRAAGLHPLVVNIEPHLEGLGTSQFVCSDENRSNRTEGVETLALVPGPTALKLIFALRHVVNQAIARNVVQRFALLDVAGRPADDDAEFNLPVALCRIQAEGSHHHLDQRCSSLP